MKIKIKLIALIFLTHFVFFEKVNAQNSGELDPSFGTEGTVITSFGNTYEHASGLIIQPDQKIVIGGQAKTGGINYPALVRLNTDGSMDNTFGVNGTAFGDVRYVLWQSETEPLAIQADGKLLFAFNASLGGEHSEIAITRFNTDGTIDTDFADDGTFVKSILDVEHSVISVIVQQDGKILVGGSVANLVDGNSQLFLLRLTTEGELDTTFISTGIFLYDVSNGADIVTDIKQQIDGKIVLLAQSTFIGTSNGDPVLIRLNENGTIDDTFGNEGISIFSISNDSDFGRCLQITDAGRIIIAGQVLTAGEVDVLLIGVTEDGELDASFGTNEGITITVVENSKDRCRAMTLAPDGKILLTGTHEDATFNVDGMVMRYTSDGLLDTDFATGGQALIQAYLYSAEQIELQADGKIVIAGWYNVVGNDYEYVCSRLYNDDSNNINNIQSEFELISLFPNPANGILNVGLKNESIHEDVIFSISDVSGRIVLQFQSASFKQKQIDTSKLPIGNYTISINGKDIHTYSRFSVMR